MPHTPSSSTAKISEIARHWGLSDDTVRALIRNSGVAPAYPRPARYHWRDIWALEGCTHVPKHLEDEFRKPLLTAVEVQRRFLPDLKLRSITDRAAKRTLPGIKLGTDWRFREHDIRRFRRGLRCRRGRGAGRSGAHVAAPPENRENDDRERDQAPDPVSPVRSVMGLHLALLRSCVPGPTQTEYAARTEFGLSAEYQH